MRLESGGAHHWLASECGFLRATRNRIRPITTGRFVGHGSFSFDRRLHSEPGKKFAQNSPNGKKPLNQLLTGSDGATCSADLFGAVQFCDIAVESTEWHVPSLACDFKHEAIRESNRRLSGKFLERGGYGFGVLNREVLVVQEHFDGSCDLGCLPVVNGSQYPRRFGQCKVRHPSALFHEFLGGSNLSGIVSRDEPHQNICINGAHSAFSCAFRSLPSIRQDSF